jgi:nitroimidazol reductase NimA-like FMN-containing flavoprotein (pyridoxamine 5'-phosphate oxidase superfamily)
MDSTASPTTPPEDGDSVPVTDRNQVHRARERGRYDRDFINRTLDTSVLCHLGYLDDGKPVVTPTVHWRIGNHVYWHGANATRYMKRSVDAQVCLTVTHLDGLVMARSAFHHSANYRSVMIFGQAEPVDDEAPKMAALKAMIEHLYPGRWDQLRPINDGEFAGTRVARVKIDEASAKVRAGAPIDDEDDYGLPIWAGVVPVVAQYQAPIDDPRQHPDVSTPQHALDLDERF